MKACRLLAAALLLFGGAAAAQPQRVMSLNLCTDELLLQLVPATRIASVSFLSRASEHPLFKAEDAHVALNYGSVEEVLAQKPDLVLTAIAPPTMKAFLQQARIPLVQVPLASNFDDIRRATRTVGRAVGETDKAEMLVAKMDAELAELATTRPARHIVVANWGGGGETLGRGTLFDAILDAAGGVNAASLLGDTRFGAFDFEQLLALRPDMIAFPDAANAHPGLRREQIQHRTVQKFYAGRQITYPEALYGCGLPQSADAARALRAAMLDIMARTQ
jgi:iron complex transport system substrate-binding protein